MVQLYDDSSALGLLNSDIDEETDAFVIPGMDDWTFGLSMDELDNLLSTSSTAPPMSSWKKPSSDEVLVSIDKARADSGKQADNDFSILFMKLVEFGIISDKEECMHLDRSEIYDRLMNWMFGPESSLFRLFEDKVSYVKGNYDLFARCISSFLVTCRYDETFEKISNSSSRGKIFDSSDGLASVEEYKLFWQAIADACMPNNRGRGTSERQAGFLPFWRSVQTALNECLRILAITNNPHQKQFVIDDDKVHRSSGRNTDRCGAKENQHVRDNRRGFTNHQLVQSASQILAGVAFDTKRGHQLEPVLAKKLYEESNAGVSGCPDIRAIYKNNTQHGPVVAIFHQYAYTGKGTSIHSSPQLESYKNKVSDCSIPFSIRSVFIALL
jgi:hypothetical protein